MPRASAYFDTSVLLKRYVDETGAPRARALLRRYRFVSSALTPVEALSALNRRLRAGELVATDFEAIVTRLRSDRAIWDLVSLSPAVLGLAEQVVRDTGVRTLDAVQLAAAQSVRTLSGQSVPFITADARQRAAAVKLGLDVTWVE